VKIEKSITATGSREYNNSQSPIERESPAPRRPSRGEAEGTAAHIAAIKSLGEKMRLAPNCKKRTSPLFRRFRSTCRCRKPRDWAKAEGKAKTQSMGEGTWVSLFERSRSGKTATAREGKYIDTGVWTEGVPTQSTLKTCREENVSRKKTKD